MAGVFTAYACKAPNELETFSAYACKAPNQLETFSAYACKAPNGLKTTFCACEAYSFKHPRPSAHPDKMTASAACSELSSLSEMSICMQG